MMEMHRLLSRVTFRKLTILPLPPTDRPADRQTDRQIDRQMIDRTNRQTDRQTDNHLCRVELGGFPDMRAIQHSPFLGGERLA